MPTELDQAYEFCRTLTKKRAKNFYYGFITLPASKRRAVYAMYAFCRQCDDAADDITDDDERSWLLTEQRAGLARTYAGRPEGPVFVAMHDAINTYCIPLEYLAAVIDGVEMDGFKTRYATFGDLKEYCYLVACSVGLVCIEIFGYSDASAREHAVDLGMAMQLTNIIRDLEEDGRRDRVYIPQEDLDRFGYSEEELFRGAVNENFKALMQFQVERAQALFSRAEKLFPLLSPRSRACPAVLHATYKRLLGRIEDSGYNVFGGRISLGAGEKLALMARLWANQLATIAAGK